MMDELEVTFWTAGVMDAFLRTYDGGKLLNDTRYPEISRRGKCLLQWSRRNKMVW